MKLLFNSFLLLMLPFANSCRGPNKVKETHLTTFDTVSLLRQPNYNYRVVPPEGWKIYDTSIQNLKLKLIIGPALLENDKPRGNMFICSMDGRNIDDFVRVNKKFLTENSPDVFLEDSGMILINNINARWFSYTKTENGLSRQMINYIIPEEDFAYMLTCGTRIRTMKIYRKTFDQIAKSFKD